MEMIFGSLIQTQIEVKLHFTSQKPTALRQFKTKDSFTTINKVVIVIETLFNNIVRHDQLPILRIPRNVSTDRIHKYS